jgi:hypothetical protein
MRTSWTIAALAGLLAVAGCKQAVGGIAGGSASGAAATAGPAAGAKRFVNNPNNNFSAKMKEKYVDFSFDYPEGWQEKIDPSESNFVQVAAPAVNDVEPTLFAVGNASAFGPPEQRRQLLESLLPQFERQFGSSFQDFEVTWRGERRVGRYETLGLGFTGRLGAEGRIVNAAGRIDIIVPADADRGVTLISLVLDEGGAPTPDQIETMPAFRTIYDSLRVGSDSK